MLSQRYEPAYPESLPPLPGAVARIDAALHPIFGTYAKVSLSRPLSLLVGRGQLASRLRADQRGAHDTRVIAKLRPRKLDGLTRRGQRFAARILDGDVEHQPHRLDDSPAEHDPLRFRPLGVSYVDDPVLGPLTK